MGLYSLANKKFLNIRKDQLQNLVNNKVAMSLL